MPAWQRMLSGRRLDLLDPSPLDVEIEDIAHGLARVARWNGQTSGDWALSVAEHSLLVERIAGQLRPRLDADARLAALLHDAHEYVLGDVISPLKRALGAEWRTMETRLQNAIHIRFGLPTVLPTDLGRLIRRADRAAARLEAVAVGEYRPNEAAGLWGAIPPALAGFELASPISPREVERAFLQRHRLLCGEMQAGRGSPAKAGTTKTTEDCRGIPASTRAHRRQGGRTC